MLFENSLPVNTSKRAINRKSALSDSEVITILVLFHYGSFKKQKHMQSEFPKTVSYNRFIELQKKVIVSLGMF